MSYHDWPIALGDEPEALPSSEAECPEGHLLHWSRSSRETENLENEGCRNIGQFTQAMTMRGSAGTQTSEFVSTAMCCPPSSLITRRHVARERDANLRRWFRGVVPSAGFSTYAACTTMLFVPGLSAGRSWLSYAIYAIPMGVGAGFGYWARHRGYGFAGAAGFAALGYFLTISAPCAFRAIVGPIT